MNPTPAVEELAISIVAKNLNPTLLTREFLVYSGIIPSDWSLASQPILNSQVAHVAFTNGINISIQMSAVTFSENILAKTRESVIVPTLIRKYIQTLPNIEYQSIGINPSIFFTFDENNEKNARHYISTRLLAPGAWQQVGNKPVRASLQLAYTLDRGQFNLKIDDVLLRRADNQPEYAVLFSGNFPSDIQGESPTERSHHLNQLLNNWQSDLETFRELIYQKFLGVALENGQCDRSSF
jgi:hypothetical protein